MCRASGAGCVARLADYGEGGVEERSFAALTMRAVVIVEELHGRDEGGSETRPYEFKCDVNRAGETPALRSLGAATVGSAQALLLFSLMKFSARRNQDNSYTRRLGRVSG